MRRQFTLFEMMLIKEPKQAQDLLHRDLSANSIEVDTWHGCSSLGDMTARYLVGAWLGKVPRTVGRLDPKVSRTGAKISQHMPRAAAGKGRSRDWPNTPLPNGRASRWETYASPMLIYTNTLCRLIKRFVRLTPYR